MNEVKHIIVTFVRRTEPVEEWQVLKEFREIPCEDVLELLAELGREGRLYCGYRTVRSKFRESYTGKFWNVGDERGL